MGARVMQNVFQVLTVVVVLGTIQNSACGKALQFTNTVALSVNATLTNRFSTRATFQLIEAVFDSPVPLNELYIGGAPATAAWAQSWSGGIAELILLAETPTEDQLNALRRYLALKYGLAVRTESDGAIVTTLSALGVDTAGLFNSVFLVR